MNEFKPQTVILSTELQELQNRCLCMVKRQSIKFKNVFKGFMQNEGKLQYVLDCKNHRKWSNGKLYFIIKNIFMHVLSTLFFQSKQETAGMHYLPRC